MHLYFRFPSLPVLLSHPSLLFSACNPLSQALLSWVPMLRQLLFELTLYNRPLEWVLEAESSSNQIVDGCVVGP